MATVENAIRQGVIVLPLIGVKDGIAELLTLPQLAENGHKRGEYSPMREGSKLRAIEGLEFPGGGVKELETIAQAGRRELLVESGVNFSPDVESRMKQIIGEFPVVQLRPELTDFAVSVMVLDLLPDEVEKMRDRGARSVMLGKDGRLVNVDGAEVALRPAHADIMYFVGGIINSLYK